MQIDTETLGPNAAAIAAAAAHLHAGRLIAFPTETVYGLGADACNAQAVAGIYAAKGRPSFNPLIAHVADAAMAQNHCVWSNDAEILARAFWPGPLTLVLPLSAHSALSSLVTAGLQSVALRVPAHQTAQTLLRAFGGPVAAPSANPSGRISPTTAAHVLAGLTGRISAVLDDGPCTVGLESTIVGLTGKTPVLLRAGGIPAEQISATLRRPLALPQTDDITAPGQLTSHYAPAGAVRLNAQGPEGDELYLGFGPMACDVNLSEQGDLVQAAARLFDCLHQLDDLARPIAVASIPQTGLGVAINDRLMRAAAPRDP